MKSSFSIFHSQVGIFKAIKEVVLVVKADSCDLIEKYLYC